MPKKAIFRVLWRSSRYLDVADGTRVEDDTADVDDGDVGQVELFLERRFPEDDVSTAVDSQKRHVGRQGRLADLQHCFLRSTRKTKQAPLMDPNFTGS